MSEPFTEAQEEQVREIIVQALEKAAEDTEVKAGLLLKEEMRQVAREEIAALAGLALRRTQDRDWTRSPDRNLAMEVANEEAAQFWGEVLAQYGKAS